MALIAAEREGPEADLGNSAAGRRFGMAAFAQLLLLRVALLARETPRPCGESPVRDSGRLWSEADGKEWGHKQESQNLSHISCCFAVDTSNWHLNEPPPLATKADEGRGVNSLAHG